MYAKRFLILQASVGGMLYVTEDGRLFVLGALEERRLIFLEN